MLTHHRFTAAVGATRRWVLAIGNFDGVHRGHQALLSQAMATATCLAAGSAILTFSPHPRRVLNPALEPQVLTTTEEKLRLVAEHGLDGAFVCAFNRAVAGMPADLFVEQVLVHGLAVVHVIVGEDYRFGARRMGDVECLRRLGAAHGFGVTTVAPVRDEDGKVISSSRVRAALSDGQVTAATQLLGRPWDIVGHGVPLHGILSIPLGDYQRPGDGVYSVRIAEACGDAMDWEIAPESSAWISSSTGDEQLHVALPTNLSKTTAFRIRFLDRLSKDAPAGLMAHSPMEPAGSWRTVRHGLIHRISSSPRSMAGL
nr:riboflavin biosynthesis protein RibF [Azospirillum sp. 412522]